MQCPKCKADMEDLEVDEVTVERCTVCRGLLFEEFRHEYLRDMEGAADIDIGYEEIGKTFNEKDEIYCPACSAPMIKMVVADQPHIWIESCSKCFAAFFDAGEFRDYVEKDFLDGIKDLLTPERK